MIPTRHKSKLPRHLSYPIGAEALTGGLAHAPHVDSLSVTFRDSPVWPASRFQQILTQSLPYPILIAEYQPARKPGYGAAKSMIEGGWYDESWVLSVCPVVRELRHATNTLIREQGLPEVARWLGASNRPGWLTREQRIEFIFHPAENTLSARATSGV